jgi:O-antigen/teichoic acid export membrane protein
MLATVLMVPIFLSHWSTTIYGEWIALSSVAAYLTTLDLGMNSAVSNDLLSSYVKHDMAAYVRSQHSALAFYVGLAAGVTVLVGVCVWFLPISHWIGLKATTHATAAYVIWLMTVQVIWTMPFGLISGTYRTLGFPAFGAWIGNFRSILLYAVTIIALCFHGDMRTLALVQLIPTVSLSVVCLLDIGRRFPEVLPGFSGAKVVVVRDLLRPSLLFALITFAMAISSQGSVLVVSSVLGGAAVAVFSTSRTLANAAMQVVGIIKNAIWPDITMLYAAEEWDKLRATNSLLVIISSSLCIAVASALWFQGSSVVEVWTRGRLHVPPSFLRWFLLYLTLQAPWMACTALPIATNKHHHLAWLYLISGVIGIGTARLLAPRYGLNAVPIGLILGDAVACYHFVIKDTCQLIHEPYLAFVRRIWVSGILIMLPTLGASWLVSRIAFGPAPLHWIEVGVVALSVSTCLTWFFWMASDDRTVLERKLFARRLRPAG